MEAVPRLPMMGFKLKQSADPPTSFNNLKLYIAELYGEDPDSYSKEVHDLETLRNVACRPSHDMDGCLKLKRYYCQLNSLVHRFPLLNERPLLTFAWRDSYSNNVVAVSDLRWEMAVILYNIAALHSQLGSEEERTTPESMKLACTHFQCAAGALEMFKEHGAPPEMTDLCSDNILLLNRLCLAQAQECILEKSVGDNRKPGIVAKVTAQILNYYNSALAMMIAGGEEGALADIMGSSKTLKASKKYLSFKVSYLSAVLYMYQGQAAEEAKKYGERVTLCQLAWDKFEEARKESTKIDSELVRNIISAAAEVIEARKKAAKNENEFIYHEEVPDISSIAAVQGANLVNGITFKVTDSELLGTDIFHRLVPMKAHEGSSVYSEEKAQLLRSIGTKIEDRDAELNGFMSSLNMEFLQFDSSAATKLPQAIVDRCASLNARPNAIPDLVSLMSQLADNCTEVEALLREIKQIFAEEEVQEKAYQQAMGQRPTVHLAELNREYQKYQEAHNKAGESNETLRKAMGLHVANLRTLSKPMADIQALVPQISSGGDGANPHFAELRMLLNKVTEMRGQRTQLVNSLREAINSDDITSKIVAWGDREMDELFRQEMGKHEKTANLIDMNLVAQGNILKALTDCYAKCASAIKQMSDTKHKRDQFFSALVASYDVYEDLLGKSTKGLEFYKKLHNNVSKLLTRVKAARDVQSEERQQRLNSTAKVATGSATGGSSMSFSGAADKGTASVSNTPKLRDYMKGGGFVPSVRPSPLGSENTAASTCVTTTATDKFNHQTMQYGSEMAVSSGNGFSQQNNSFVALPVTVNHGGYYGQQGAYGYGAQTSQQQPNTGYTNPIYQTGSIYGMSQDQMNPSYNSYSVANTSVQSATGVPSTTATSVVGGSGYSSGNIPTHGATGSELYNPTSSYSTVPAVSTSTDAYAGYPQQQPQYQNYRSDTNSYPTGTTSTATSNRATTIDYTSAHTSQTPYSTTTPYSYATTTEGANAPGQSYGGQPGSIPQQPYSQPNQNYNQYSTSTSTGSTMISGHQSNIPQVSHQMSQMSISGPTETANAYGNYYYGASGGQTYYGQAEGTLQYPNQQQTQQPFGTQSSDTTNNSQYSDPTQGVTNYQQSPYNASQGYGYGNQGVTYPQDDYSGQQQQTTYAAPVSEQSNAPVAIYPISSTGGYPTNQTISTPNVSQTSYQTPANYPNQPVQAQPTVPQPSTPAVPAATPVNPSTNSPATVETKAPINPRDLDLLSGIDFAAPVAVLPQPMLQPKPAGSASAANSVVVEKEPVKSAEPEKKEKSSALDDDVVSVLLDDSQRAPPQAPLTPSTGKLDHIKSFLASAQQQQPHSHSSSPSIVMDRKMSMDNISICSEISSIDQNFDWESVSVRNELVGGAGEQNEAILSKFRTDGGSDDPKVIKWFHSEVERLEKFLEGVNIKTLNGSTPLDKKWQEVQNLLAKDAGKRTTSVAKLFPEKNRSSDSIPYDHARVQLPTATDDYVNACLIKDLGSGCPPLILAQTPMQNTNKDFWHLVWSQKSKLIVCLHTPNEMIHPFWPMKLQEEVQFDDFSVTLLKQFDLTNSVEFSLKLSMSGSETTHELSVLQLKSWSQNVPSQIVAVARDVITSYLQRVGGSSTTTATPIVINCLTGSKRSPLIAVTVAAVLATQSKRPLLINLVDAWFRIATQRRGVLENERELEYSFQVLLSNAHDLLNKHGIMTPYQVKNAQKAAIIEKEQIKDPLAELDALWKLKK